MPMEAGLTKAQRAARAEERARVLRDADRFARVTNVLKNDSTRLYKTEQDMIRDGLLAPVVVETVERRPKLPMLEDMPAQDRADSGDENGEGPDLPDGVPTEVLSISKAPWDRNKSYLKDAGVKALQYALSLCEPVAFSVENQGFLMQKGAREKNRVTLLRLIELFTKLNGDTRIDPSCRNDRDVTTMIIKAYREHGNLGAQYNLKDFNQETGEGGNYTFSVNGTACKVTERWTDEERTITVPRTSELYIDQNWGSNATLRQKNGSFKMPLAAIFLSRKASKSASVGSSGDAAEDNGGHRPGNYRRRCKGAEITTAQLVDMLEQKRMAGELNFTEIESAMKGEEKKIAFTGHCAKLGEASGSSGSGSAGASQKSEGGAEGSEDQVDTGTKGDQARGKKSKAEASFKPPGPGAKKHKKDN